MFFGEWLFCVTMHGHDWRWITKRTQECYFCGKLRTVK